MLTTRRNFLSGALAALAAPPALFAASAADFDENLAVLLSDLHVSGLDGPPKGGKPYRTHPRAWLRRSVAEILKMTPLPRHVFVFGDIAYLQGRVEDYRRSAPELKLLVDAGINLTLGLGNHDHRKAFLEVWPEYAQRTRVPGLIHTVTSLPEFDLILLYTLDEKDDPNAFNPVGGTLASPHRTGSSPSFRNGIVRSSSARTIRLGNSRSRKARNASRNGSSAFRCAGASSMVTIISGRPSSSTGATVVACRF